MTRGNAENLIPANRRTKEEVREMGRRGGIKSGEARRRKKAAREVAGLILGARIPEEEARAQVAKLGLPETELNVQAAMLAAMASKGMDGDIRAIEALLALGGEKEGAGGGAYDGLPARVLGKAYIDIYRDICGRRHRFYDFRGGRGSLKSTFCAEVMIDELERNPQLCGIAIRQVKDTLKDSVYAQLEWVIEELGLVAKYKCTGNPLEIKRPETGQRIYFRGADDPAKLKSIRPPKGKHIGVVWIEEADQLHGREALRNILQSVMRGGEDAIILRSYNTPVSAQHYINREAREERPNRVVHHSYYTDVPREWLGGPFFEEAEYLRETNGRAYRHEYLGEAVGAGGTVFENVTTREILGEEMQGFERCYHGVDFGFYPDPWVYVKCCYDAARRRLYVFDEAAGRRLNNRQTADMMKEKGLTGDDELICDSADPKSIADYVEYGLYARGAEKGPGSVNYSMKWLQGLAEIVIDPGRCPVCADEFLCYEYEKTADGEVMSGYPDRNNHCIDAVRYATNMLWRQRGI